MVVKSSVLKELEECYRESGNQLVVLYGRTDSEKERLLGAFVQNKKHFYYRARQVAEREQRAQMGRELAARFEVMLQKYTYEEYFNRVKSGDPTKLVVVIDEFQYIAKKDPTFMEAVLKLKVHRLYPGPVMILLCSSAVSWAERELAECIGEGGMPQNRPENQIYESEFSGSGAGAARVSGGGMYQDLRHHRRCAGIHQPLERKSGCKDQYL